MFGLLNIQTLAAQGSFDDQLTEFSLFDRGFPSEYWSFCVYLYKLLCGPTRCRRCTLIQSHCPSSSSSGRLVSWLPSPFGWLVLRKNRIAVFGTAFFL